MNLVFLAIFLSIETLGEAQPVARPQGHPICLTTPISEYDLLPTYTKRPVIGETFYFDFWARLDTGSTPGWNGNSPILFEQAMNATGITEEEYAACNSSIHQDPDRKICLKLIGHCYRIERDGTKTRAPCPDTRDVKVVDDFSPVITMKGLSKFCLGNDEPDSSQTESSAPTCTIELQCVQTTTQWNAPEYWLREQEAQKKAAITPGEVVFSLFDLDDVLVSHGTFNSYPGGYNAGMSTDGPFVYFDTISNTYTRPNHTEPYSMEGQICLMKAALKALSKNGWELADPASAFQAENWTVVRKVC